MKIADQAAALLCVFLVAWAMLADHINQGLRNEIAALEAGQEELASRNVVGWWRWDEATLQLYFVEK